MYNQLRRIKCYPEREAKQYQRQYDYRERVLQSFVLMVVLRDTLEELPYFLEYKQSVKKDTNKTVKTLNKELIKLFGDEQSVHEEVGELLIRFEQVCSNFLKGTVLA